MRRTMKRLFLSAGIAALSTGCGGVHTGYYYQPAAPIHSTSHSPVGKTAPYRWEVTVSDVKVAIYSVKLGSKLICVVGPACIIPTLWEEADMKEGPLQIRVVVEGSGGDHVNFDPREFVVVTDDGKSHAPRVGCEPLQRDLEGVEFSGERTWLGCLEYGLEVLDLGPFWFRLDSLRINGEATGFPPVPFVHWESSYSS